MRFSFVAFFSAFFLGSCSYAVDSTFQDVTVLAPEAQDARCYIFIDKRKYQAYPPQTINVRKSAKDMVVECDAPGNRRVEMVVPARFSTRSIWGGPPGIAWDYASESLYYYPDVIAVDFSNEDLRPNGPPQHNNSDIRQPEEYDLEEFLPAEPILNSEKGRVQDAIKPRIQPENDHLLSIPVDSHSAEGLPMAVQGKGDLTPVSIVPGQ